MIMSNKNRVGLMACSYDREEAWHVDRYSSDGTKIYFSTL